ncbi:MAG: hypothetical protein AABN95_19370 [Acidobacteriota bacterium]
MQEIVIDYKSILSEADLRVPAEAILKLSEELPHVWADAYKKTSPHQANILRIKRNGFEYLFDCSIELVRRGDVASNKAVEDRIVVVHGLSQAVHQRRQDSLMRKHPLGPVDFIRAHNDSSYSDETAYDKGHFIGHTLGGQLHINLFPQSKRINRGWSDPGKLYRKMERYCQKNPGTYCFSRPIYAGYSGHPTVIEFGVFKSDGTLWVNQFPNCDSSEEMDKIEQLFRAKIAGKDDEQLRSIL